MIATNNKWIEIKSFHIIYKIYEKHNNKLTINNKTN